MRCFEVEGGGAREGIPLTKAGKIALGEEGRGRKLVSFPLPKGAVVSEGRVMELPGHSTSVAVVIRDHSGFRGGWSLDGACTPKEWDEQVAGEERAHRDVVLGGKTAAPRLPQHLLPEDLWIITQGECAQGDAGRMGGGPEYLLVLENGQAVEISRRGRLYGKPSVIRLECVDGSLKVSIPRQEAEERLAAAKLSEATAKQ